MTPVKTAIDARMMNEVRATELTSNCQGISKAITFPYVANFAVSQPIAADRRIGEAASGTRGDQEIRGHPGIFAAETRNIKFCLSRNFTGANLCASYSRPSARSSR